MNAKHSPIWMFQLLIMLFTGCDVFSDFEEGVTESAEQFTEQFRDNLNNQQKPYAFLLTWQRDPTTTITIDWYTAPPVSVPDSISDSVPDIFPDTLPVRDYELPVKDSETVLETTMKTTEEKRATSGTTTTAASGAEVSTGRKMTSASGAEASTGMATTPTSGTEVSTGTTTAASAFNTITPLSNRIQYRENGVSEWTIAKGHSSRFPFSDSLMIHRVELSDLSPGRTYEFRFRSEGETYRFRTMPADLRRPVRFITGGDMMHDKALLERMNRFAADADPDFVVLGGDLAYADGEAEKGYRWLDYLKTWSETLITEDRRIIPHLSSIGNHEVREAYIYNYGGEYEQTGYEQTDMFRQGEAPYYYSLMAFPGQPGYGALDFGDYLSLFLLDTDHTNPVDGQQSEWLSQALSRRSHIRYKIPVYHVAAYPSVREFNGYTQTRIRKSWVPLFEEHDVRVAFESHDHAYKRSYPLLKDKVHEEGIHYIGDGAWGVRTREIDPDHDRKKNYLNQSRAIRHLIQVTLTDHQIQLRMVDENGVQFDELEIR